jgi:hypothetical protein
MIRRELTWRGGVPIITETVVNIQCTRLQGRLALGPERCAIIDAIAADPNTPWAMAEAIRSAVTWSRNDQQIDELAWLLGLSDQDVDDLFALAITL